MIREETHSVCIRVLSKGRGPALVFFHGPWGLTWDPFLEELAQDDARRAGRQLSPRRTLGSRPLL